MILYKHLAIILLTLIFVYKSNAFGSYFYCKFNECCEEPWIINNITNLTLSLKLNVFGQHLVQNSLPKLIKGHLNNPKPLKPLVLSFHGWTGTGKTWVSKLITESLYTEGLNSKFVKFIPVPHFFRDTLRTRELAENLHHKMMRSLETCPHTLFIFEDIQYMNPRILDELVMYLNYPQPLAGIDFTKAIYIFLSNSGATKINDYAAEQFMGGRRRESISLGEMHQIISDKIYSEDGAFKNTDFVKRQVIDASIPFLPLEKGHIKDCIKRAILGRGEFPYESIIKKVLKDVRFVPEGIERFAEVGCKRIDQIITDYLE
ncbi:Torsin-1B [Oopsacas minuta]|uniref:Torsin-1B n=1 Tax=Oopsacas minuta TaxID=111878 RepID=A0AAV7JC27_9METZ|nr:Torsin-1B [Oopsacas minuta]